MKFLLFLSMGLASAALDDLLSYAGDVFASHATPASLSDQVKSDFAAAATNVVDNPLVQPVLDDFNTIVDSDNGTDITGTAATLLDDIGKLLGGFLNSNDTDQLLMLMGRLSDTTAVDDESIDKIFAKAQEDVGTKIDALLPQLGGLLGDSAVQAKALGVQGGLNQFLANAKQLRMGNASTVDLLQNTKLGLGEVVTLDGTVLLLGPAGQKVASTIGPANVTSSVANSSASATATATSAAASGSASSSETGKKNAASNLSPSLAMLVVSIVAYLI
ncbi:hypothetical protein CJU90_0204 [Yarrowia sp. C11]|nr:hypothetical protein CKK34_1617 [Yarrowia sp. E02]KAG5372557.1 hypothetical protein CJU90_0204 [Yarrowia sp. C11]